MEDLIHGGYASAISQTVLGYSDPNIFFAWAAVLESAHGVNDSATVKIVLSDLSAGDDLITRIYNAASSGGGGPVFNYNASTGFYWTPWQIEQLTLPADRIGHDIRLTVLAADCQPTGHAGYVYLDGFGAAPPPTDGEIPEPSTIGLVAAGMGLLALRLRRRSAH